MISILIPTYNYSVHNLVVAINEQCQELKLQYEILVQEDASEKSFQTQNQQINCFENCSYSCNSINIGRTKTRETLALNARYNWLLFLDSDVLPVDKEFIANYIKCLNLDYSIVNGGVKYQVDSQQLGTLRYKYGKFREEKKAAQRSLNPYNSIVSGNLLVKKELFLETNYSGNDAVYGLDIYFAYCLFKKQIAILHIDNCVFHLGIENNAVFLKKSLESVNSRKEIMVDLDEIEKINGLIKKYKALKKYKFVLLVKLLFYFLKPIFHKNLLSKYPNLFLFDCYRLGYLCTLK